ncbi:Sucrose-phosphate synthase-like protein [Drosera capensis]
MKRGVSCLGRFMPRMSVSANTLFPFFFFFLFEVMQGTCWAEAYTHLPSMVLALSKPNIVIPPGMEFNHIVPHDADMDGDAEAHDENTSSDPPIWSEIMRFFTNRRKPMILALARPDPKKNLTTLVKAFGECRPLRELANLTLIMGNRDDIDEMSGTSASVLVSILKLIDKYDLYGQVAYPKHHKQVEVPEIYRLAAKTKGVFINPAFIEPFGLTLIEAAAYGLPIVATKNGGPVDIIKVLDNGLLVDPHDQKSIADALLKLVADKQLWSKCKNAGLKNIHLFSWTEHCKTYLSRIASCKPRQPNWQKSDLKFEESESDSPGDSLNIQDISLNLKLSLDGEKTEGGSNLDDTLDSEENAVDAKSKMENAVLKLSKSMDKAHIDGGNLHGHAARRRKYVFVIAVDSDSSSGLLEIVRTVLEAAVDLRSKGPVGIVISTALTIAELNSILQSGGLSASEFDAFICNSGGELYYPSTRAEDKSTGFPFIKDSNYHSHVEYRWGGENLRKTLVKWATSVNEKKGQDGAQIVIAEDSASTSHCYAFKVNDFSLLTPLKELRKFLRFQALRCHSVYCLNGTRLNVIPVMASRSQALRYLYVRWHTELSNFVVFTGEYGDTDYETLLGGIHKKIVLKAVCSEARKLHANRVYPLEHVVSFDSPNIVQAGGSNPEDILAALGKLGILKS